MPKKIFIIAGEASGDLHGANLIKHLRAEAAAPIEIYGIGGDKMREIGALEFFDLAHFHATGFTEAIRRIPQYKKAEALLLQKLKKVKPDLVVLIDNPGFNLHLAPIIHRMSIPIVYYIAPQIWAWAPKRIFKIKKYIHKVIVVFEFEKKIYEEHGVPVAWVGHPLRDLIPASDPGKKPDRKVTQICLLPGSRKGELKMLFAIFAKAAKLITKKIPSAAFILIKSPTLPRSFYERIFQENHFSCALIENNAYGEIQKSDLAIVCSGTATLECALLGTPLIISNKGSLITYITAKALAKVRYLGIPNLIFNEERFPEFLQYNATPEKISNEAVKILTDVTRKQKMAQDLLEIAKKIGPPGATQRAAQEILNVII